MNKQVTDRKGAKLSLPMVQRQQLSHREFTLQDFRNGEFYEANFKGSTFDQCDFSYSIFDRAYFNMAQFNMCNFTGCRFVECNLERSRMTLCELRFARFERSLLEPNEILSNAPESANLKRELLRSLQANAVEIGAYKSQRQFALAEIAATKHHYWSAVFGGDEYYEKKFPTLPKKIAPALGWVWLSLLDLVWGNGEKPGNMFFSLLAILTFLSAVNAFPVAGALGWSESWFGFRSVGYVFTTFLSITANPEYRGFWLIDYLTAALRYLYIGLFISVVYRASVHR